MTTWYDAEIAAAASRYGLPPDLVTAVVITESSGLTHAYRYEPAFWARYLKDKPEWDGSNPARVSASYGLMQVMFPVAVELGFNRHEPPEYLFVPIIGLEYGCKKLRAQMDWAKGDVRAALASYNGGKLQNAPGGPLRNEAYVAKVERRLAVIQGDRRA